MTDEPSKAGAALLYAFSAFLALVGVYLIWFGGRLALIGGSPYYVIAGAAVLASSVLLFNRKRAGAAIYGAFLLATLVWAVWESGWDGWALMPRLLAPAIVGLVLLLPALRRQLSIMPAVPWGRLALGLLIACLVGTLLHSALPPRSYADPLYQAGTGTAPPPIPVASTGPEWRNIANDPGGSRFTTLDQITPKNVGKLRQAWSFATGKQVGLQGDLQGAPLMVNGKLYFCAQTNKVFALDPETGRKTWDFDPKLTSTPRPCRGVAYFAVPGGSGPCAKRILTNTYDARLLALDAETGRLCPDFGKGGTVDLREGMGEVVPGYYGPTAPPLIVNGLAVVNGVVLDGQHVGEPSGVIRAFDATTGELAWAWDLGRPDRTGAPPPGETYTRGTPNSWPPMSADPDLGLVYVPLGNPTPDYFGALRRPFDEEFGSALVALDAATGRLKWKFNTIHHDIWDYDIASQPSLVDIRKDGKLVPALVQPTKRGEVFVLDRRTGKPIYPVREKPVPQDGKASEEWLSPTQPYSVGLPSLRGPRLTEQQMWGITPLDHLWCRTKFREARYDGDFTPTGPTPAIQYPGYVGGSNWGGVTIDKSRRIAVFNVNHVANYTWLIPRAEADEAGLHRYDPERDAVPDSGYNPAQEGTPYAMRTGAWLSPLLVPCNQPPFGRLMAVNLETGKLIWVKRFGTSRASGPFMIPSLLPLPMGVPNTGGGMATQTGLFFIGAAQDRYLRAFETASGKLLWKASLPGGGNSFPVTYIGPRSGRQFVVITAGGSMAAGARPSDRVVAFALEKE